MFENKNKLWSICFIIFSLLLASGCSVNIDKDAEPGVHIYKVDKKKDDKEETNK
ncbi:hypothetical protein [Cytobacillus dafuensis]|uniref:hypothetical protein n=1 Tax=Cytobacillus dafuensis TaxID=1742359 RepID=UPI000A95368C|nr:hypothetical protein [Cytobacillus dafuensis]